MFENIIYDDSYCQIAKDINFFMSAYGASQAYQLITDDYAADEEGEFIVLDNDGEKLSDLLISLRKKYYIKEKHGDNSIINLFLKFDESKELITPKNLAIKFEEVLLKKFSHLLRKSHQSKELKIFSIVKKITGSEEQENNTHKEEDCIDLSLLQEINDFLQSSLSTNYLKLNIEKIRNNYSIIESSLLSFIDATASQGLFNIISNSEINNESAFEIQKLIKRHFENKYFSLIIDNKEFSLTQNTFSSNYG